MTPPKVLIADPIAQRGIEELSRDDSLDVVVRTGLSENELVDLIADFSALIVRSETKVTAKVLAAAMRLRVIGRAGVGVDNVDVETATRRGIVVLNAPGGNTVSTAEHAFSLLLSVARKIPQADASVRGGNWKRKDFEGVELYNKTLGVIGMGRIGSELSRRAISFGMRVLAYDPYLSPSRARGLQVELLDELDDLLASADFISLHTPLAPETRHIVDLGRIRKMKPGVRIGSLPTSATACCLFVRVIVAIGLLKSTVPSITESVVTSIPFTVSTARTNSVPFTPAAAPGVRTRMRPGLSRWKKERSPLKTFRPFCASGSSGGRTSITVNAPKDTVLSADHRRVT